MIRARRELVLAALALFGTLAIYFVWRDGLWLHRALPGLHAAARSSSHVPSWFRFSLPDALWQLSFCLTMLAAWKGEPWTAKKIAWVSLPIVIGVATELGQLIHVVPGTFDPVDLLSSLAAFGFALAVSSK